MSFTVLYDANALFGNTARDLLIRVARIRLVEARWTERILDELDRALTDNRDIDPVKLKRRRQLMNLAVADCIVEGYEPLIEELELPDPDDRHVLAAAIKSGAQVIVTDNLKHFPDGYLRRSDWRRRARTTSSSGSWFGLG